MIGDRPAYETGGDRRAVVVQDRHQAYGIDAAFVDDERTQLAVAVLLDDEDEVVVADEVGYARMEGEGAHAQPIERMAALLDHMDRLVHRRRGRTIIDDAVFRRFSRVGLQRPWNQILRGLELA